MVVVPCLTICRDRNSRAFEGVELALISIKPSFLRILYDWMSTFGGIHSTFFVDFIDLLNFQL